MGCVRRIESFVSGLTREAAPPAFFVGGWGGGWWGRRGCVSVGDADFPAKIGAICGQQAGFG